MSYQILPTDTTPNQTFTAALTIGSSQKTLQFNLRYNEMAGYWVMTIIDPSSGSMLLDSLPLVTGDYPAANLLGQYGYLGLGSLCLINASNTTKIDYPDDSNLGTDFVLVWGSE
jgi:hypothetical protein